MGISKHINDSTPTHFSPYGLDPETSLRDKQEDPAIRKTDGSRSEDREVMAGAISEGLGNIFTSSKNAGDKKGKSRTTTERSSPSR